MSEAETDTGIVSKLTIKTMGCKPQLAAALGQKVPVARIMGIAYGTKVVEAANGDVFTAITGQFEGTNLETGQVFQSGVLYLPAGFHEQIADPLKKENAPEQIEFAMELYAVPADNLSGYSYEAKPLIKIVEADPLASLRNTLSSLPKPKFPALPKPEGEAGKSAKK